MALSAPFVTLAGLMEIAFPGHTARFADGAATRWGAVDFDVSDSVFGTVATVQVAREGLGDMAPGGTISLITPGTTAPGDLSHASFQGSTIRIWLAEIDRATGLVTGVPDLLFDGLVDVTRLANRDGARVLEIDMISHAERLFLVNEGNVCSSRFHQSAWPGELGFDNAVGLPISVAWGVDAPARGVSSGSYRGVDVRAALA